MKKLSGFIASCIIALVSIAGCSESSDTSLGKEFTHNGTLYYITDATILYSATDRTVRFMGINGTETLGVQFTFVYNAGEIPSGTWTIFDATHISAVDLVYDLDPLDLHSIYTPTPSGSLTISGKDGENLKAAVNINYSAGTVTVDYDGAYTYTPAP